MPIAYNDGKKFWALKGMSRVLFFRKSASFHSEWHSTASFFSIQPPPISAMPNFLIICLSIVCTGFPAFAETFEFGQQHISPDDSHQQIIFQETESSGENSNQPKNQNEFDEGRFDRGAFDPLNETLPGETGEDGESSSMADPESMLPGENAEQFKEDDQEPREREGFLRTLPGGLN